MILRVRNWGTYQHYKDRCPPWIKLHFKLLSSRDWVVLADASRVLAIACMLVASQSGGNPGEFDADGDYLKRVAYLNTDPDFKPLIDCGFLEIVDGVLADASGRKQTLEKCTTETETETEKKYAPDGEIFPGVPEQVVRDFKRLRQKLRAPVTPTAMAGISREAAKAGISLADALAMCCERGWRGFKADWVSGTSIPAQTAGTPRRRRELGA